MKKRKHQRSLKAINAALLVSTLVFDVLVLFALTRATGGGLAAITSAIALRAGLLSLAPVPALLLSSILPPLVKASLVYWRWSDPLPGSRSFSVHALTDPRINVPVLKRNVGVFPTVPAEQNAKWYSLYKAVEHEPSVLDAHGRFLLFRDIAAMSALLCLLGPAAALTSAADGPTPGLVLLVFAIQYVLTALAGRASGVRLVQTVLAIHASQPVTRAPRPSKKRVDP
jgi:hypothetical protein